jgi:hypothetical protein
VTNIPLDHEPFRYTGCCPCMDSLTGCSTKLNFLDVVPHLENQHHRPEPERKISYEADIRRVRLQQQELARESAIEAAKERKAQEEQAKLRKNKAALPPGHNEGDRLGRSSNNSFNPLEPWTQSNGGGGYKPAKRTVCRGCA